MCCLCCCLLLSRWARSDKRRLGNCDTNGDNNHRSSFCPVPKDWFNVSINWTIKCIILFIIRFYWLIDFFRFVFLLLFCMRCSHTISNAQKAIHNILILRLAVCHVWLANCCICVRLAFIATFCCRIVIDNNNIILARIQWTASTRRMFNDDAKWFSSFGHIKIICKTLSVFLSFYFPILRRRHLHVSLLLLFVYCVSFSILYCVVNNHAFFLFLACFVVKIEYKSSNIRQPTRKKKSIEINFRCAKPRFCLVVCDALLKHLSALCF